MLERSDSKIYIFLPLITNKNSSPPPLPRSVRRREIELAAKLLYFTHHSGSSYTLITTVGCFVWGEEGSQRPRAIWRLPEAMKEDVIVGHDAFDGVEVVRFNDKTMVVTDGTEWEELDRVTMAGVVKEEGGFIVGIRGGKVAVFKKNKGGAMIEGGEVDVDVGDVVGLEVGKEGMW